MVFEALVKHFARDADSFHYSVCGTLVISSVEGQDSLKRFLRITATILAPTPLVAANFVILGKVILSLGPAYSRLSPKWCMRFNI